MKDVLSEVKKMPKAFLDVTEKNHFAVAGTTVVSAAFSFLASVSKISVLTNTFNVSCMAAGGCYLIFKLGEKLAEHKLVKNQFGKSPLVKYSIATVSTAAFCALSSTPIIAGIAFTALGLGIEKFQVHLKKMVPNEVVNLSASCTPIAALGATAGLIVNGVLKTVTLGAVGMSFGAAALVGAVATPLVMLINSRLKNQQNSLLYAFAVVSFGGLLVGVPVVHLVSTVALALFLGSKA